MENPEKEQDPLRINIKEGIDLDENEVETGNSGFHFLEFLKEIGTLVLMSLLIVIPIRFYLIQPFVVNGASMEPNFHDGEYLIINEIGYRLGDPERGEVVVFKNPKDEQEYYIKRVIGLPGESVEVRGGNVIIYNEENPQGFTLEEDYLPNGLITRGDVYQTLKDDEYFVLGDNRNKSSDSRVWGAVEDDLVIGRAWIRVLPFSKFTLFSN